MALWVLEPALTIDASETGSQAALRARMLWEEAWDAVLRDDLSLASRAQGLVASSHELQLEEEPDDPSVYRLDFLAALLYALRTYNHDSQQDLEWCLQRIGASLEFLGAEGFTLLGSIDIDGLIFAAIQSLEAVTNMNTMTLEELRKSFVQAHDTCKRSLQSTDA